MIFRAASSESPCWLVATEVRNFISPTRQTLRTGVIVLGMRWPRYPAMSRLFSESISDITSFRFASARSLSWVNLLKTETLGEKTRSILASLMPEIFAALVTMLLSVTRVRFVLSSTSLTTELPLQKSALKIAIFAILNPGVMRKIIMKKILTGTVMSYGENRLSSRSNPVFLSLLLFLYSVNLKPGRIKAYLVGMYGKLMSMGL